MKLSSLILLILFIQTQIYAQTLPLVHLKFDGSVQDHSSNNHSIGIVGDVQFTYDRFGNPNSAMLGKSGRLTLPMNVFNYQYEESFTLSFWVKTDGSNSGRIFSTECPEGNFRISSYGDGEYAFQFGAPYAFDQLSVKEWTHLAYVYSNNSWIIYKNGVSYKAGTLTDNEDLNYNCLSTIGAKASSAYDMWGGAIDEFRLYGEALSAQEISSVYNSEILVNTKDDHYFLESGLFAEFTFNGTIEDQRNKNRTMISMGTEFTTDRFGHENSALHFAGGQQNSAYLSTQDIDDILLNEYTYSVWLRVDEFNQPNQGGLSFAYQSIISINSSDWTYGPASNLSLDLNDNSKLRTSHWFYDDFKSEEVKTQPHFIDLNEWTHLVVTYNGAEMSLYKNGVLFDTNNMGVDYEYAEYLIIGADRDGDTPGDFFGGLKGDIDDIKIYHGAFYPDEVATLYAIESNFYEAPSSFIHVSIPDQNVYTIDTTYTSVYLEDVPEAGFNAFQYALSFDPDSIDVEILDSEFTLSADYELTMNEEAAGYILIAGAGNTPITTDGNLTDIKISYKTGGVSTLAIEELMFNEGEPIASSAPSRIDAELLVCGDVTADNTVSALDAAHILRHTVRLSPQYPLEGRDFIAGDVTSNGAVTAYDAYFVLRDIVGMGSGLSCTSTIYNLKEPWTPKLSWSLYSKGADLVTPIYLSEDTPEVYALEVEVPNGAEVKVVGLPGDWNTLEYTNEGTQYLSMYGLTPLSSPELIWERTMGQIMEARVRINESQWQTIEHELEVNQVLPEQYILSQNYPNPFNPNTQISYALPEASQVTLEVFNSLGQKVATLVDAQKSAGYHTASFDASQLSSGVYLYKLSTPGFSQTKKMLLVK